MQIIGHFDTNIGRALSEIYPKWRDLPGLIVCGSHGPYEFVESAIDEITRARQSNTPILGICLGYQLAHIEWARNVKGIKNATSEEWGTGTFVVKKRPKIKVGLHEGESWWSNYDVVEEYDFPSNYVLVPFHPEYQSFKGKPHPLLVRFIQLAKKYEVAG